MPPKRFQHWHGIPIPPFKEDKLGAGSTTIRFILPGKIISKKNNQLAFANRVKAKEFLNDLRAKKLPIGYDEAWQAIHLVTGDFKGNDEWELTKKHFAPIIEGQKKYWLNQLGGKGLTFPLYRAAMTMRLYFKAAHITDTVNKQQTIQDLLIHCNVIANDDYRVLNPIKAASACYKDELVQNLAFISLSFRL